MAHVYPALMKQVLDVAERQREPDIHHHRQTDHFRRCLEIAKRANLAYALTPQVRSWPLKTRFL